MCIRISETSIFDNRDKQLTDLASAYQSFLQTVNGLSPADFLRSLGDWTPRYIAAHFIGWNRITLVGCAELREGVEPFYFYDGTNDYRKHRKEILAAKQG